MGQYEDMIRGLLNSPHLNSVDKTVLSRLLPPTKKTYPSFDVMTSRGDPRAGFRVGAGREGLFLRGRQPTITPRTRTEAEIDTWMKGNDFAAGQRRSVEKAAEQKAVKAAKKAAVAEEAAAKAAARAEELTNARVTGRNERKAGLLAKRAENSAARKAKKLASSLSVSNAVAPAEVGMLSKSLKWGGRALGGLGLAMTALQLIDGYQEEFGGRRAAREGFDGLSKGLEAAQLQAALQAEEQTSRRVGWAEDSMREVQMGAANRQMRDEAELMGMMRDRAGELDQIAERYQPNLAEKLARLGVL